jgi:hypothetical protein
MSSTMFSEAVARIDQADADVHSMFGGQTQVAHRTRRADPRWNAQLLEAERFVRDIRDGRRGLHQFAEAMSTSDFPLLFADSLDRQLYGAYQATVPTWRNYARPALVNDFRTVKRFATSGVRGILNKVGELSEHERRSQTEVKYEYAVSKYEAGFALSLEAMINDDLNAFMNLPQDLAASVVDSEERFVTSLFADASGPHATYYTGGNLNLLTGNPSLTRSSLQTAITALMSRVDANGNPIIVTAMELVVGPGLATTAREITEASEYRIVGANGDVTVINGNGVAGNLRTSVNYWIPSVCSTANASTSWWLFANPQGARPALEFGHLRGFEAPALYEKVPDSRRIGGGVEMFSFDTSASEKKVMAVFGGSFVDPKMTVGSRGTNA